METGETKTVRRRPFWLDRNKTPNAFSHALGCDDAFSKIDDVPGGARHINCNCWCHAIAFDRNEPPEYVKDSFQFSGLQFSD